MNNKNSIDETVKIVINASKYLSSMQEIKIQEKEGIGNIVTNVDLNIENFLKNELKQKFPESQIIAEESSDTIEEEKDLKFVIDPLDGSTNFTNNWPHTIAVGIIYKNELISGIIYDAIMQEIYFSIKGEGVFKISIQNPDGIFKVSFPQYKKEQIKKSVIVHDLPYGEKALENTIRMYSNLAQKGASTKTIGPISLDVLKTALGQENRPHDYNDAVWHMEVRAWDLCASTAILRELGGNIIGSNGKTLDIETLSNPQKKITFFASGNNKLLDELYTTYQNCMSNL